MSILDKALFTNFILLGFLTFFIGIFSEMIIDYTGETFQKIIGVIWIVMFVSLPVLGILKIWM